ncbi:MAG: adenylyltransferase/cytidyltransferase family protein [Candidatus Poseidoniaceae archaeon]
MAKGIVLGRFQPFHKGHEHLVLEALELFQEVTIAVGSSQEEWTTENPFSFQERKLMIESWVSEKDLNQRITIVGIEDINDPPNWVEHASKTHGEGTLVTSDENTKNLYENNQFPVHWIELHQRVQFEGWRVRQSCMMLSTVYDDDATRSVLTPSVPIAIIEWLITNDALYRFLQLNAGPHAG